MFSFIIGLVGVVLALVGWYAFESLILLIIGTLLYFVETVLERNNLSKNAIVLEFTIIVIGCIIGFFCKHPFYVYGMLAINLYKAVLSIISIIYMIKTHQNKNNI